jgi:DNA-directed RNA polymerase specialized sigma24 family protein
MFQSTTTENFQSWDKFLSAYYEPIRAALGLMPFVGVDRADDVANEFFLKLYERDLLANRPVIAGRFRDWLYVAARNHALDEWRKLQRRRERPETFEVHEPADPRADVPHNLPFDADECYALSVLHLTVNRVRKHLLQEGKAEHWMIFEELALAPLIPGRAAKSREELLAMFPGEGPAFLDNRMTTVKRVFRRILPALIPVDPTENRTAEQRFEELLAILRASANTRLWLAFLVDPSPDPGVSAGSSLDLAAGPGSGGLDAAVSSDILHDELRVLLSFWLEMPLEEIRDDRELASEPAARATRPRHSAHRSGSAAASVPQPPISLRVLIDEAHPASFALPDEELKVLLERVKTFAKRVHRSRPIGHARRDPGPGARRFEDAMPFEIAQVLYNLAGALALTRCHARIVGLSDEQFRKNITWVLSQSWLDPRLRPVFFAAMSRLRPAKPHGESP